MTIILLFIAVILSMMFPWLIPLFILLGIVIYFIKEAYKNSDYGKKQTIEKNKKIVKEAKALQERMNSCGVFPTYSVTNGISTIYFDENNRRVYLKYKDNTFPNSDLKEIALNVDGIISYSTNVKKDSNIQYTMGTYFTGKLKVNEDIDAIWLSLQLNSIDTPYIYVLCSDYSIGIPEANQFVNKVIGALDYIKNNKVIAKKTLLKIVPDLETEIAADEEKKKESFMGLFKSKEEKLKEKMEQSEKIKKGISKGIKNIFNIISYGIACFLYLGAIVCLMSKEINYAIGYFSFGTPFLPIIYEKLWKDKNVSIAKKVVVRIVLFIIGFIIGGIFLSK